MALSFLSPQMQIPSSWAKSSPKLNLVSKFCLTPLCVVSVRHLCNIYLVSSTYRSHSVSVLANPRSQSTIFLQSVMKYLVCAWYTQIMVRISSVVHLMGHNQCLFREAKPIIDAGVRNFHSCVSMGFRLISLPIVINFLGLTVSCQLTICYRTIKWLSSATQDYKFDINVIYFV